MLKPFVVAALEGHDMPHSDVIVQHAEGRGPNLGLEAEIKIVRTFLQNIDPPGNYARYCNGSNPRKTWPRAAFSYIKGIILEKFYSDQFTPHNSGYIKR